MEKLEPILKTLRRELEDGRYAHLAHFPSEYELSERFGVNKKTANKAVSLLVAGGLLVRGTRGQGTRVVSGLLFHREQIAFIGDLLRLIRPMFFMGFERRHEPPVSGDLSFAVGPDCGCPEDVVAFTGERHCHSCLRQT